MCVVRRFSCARDENRQGSADMLITLIDQRDGGTREMEFSHAAVSIGSDSSNIIQLPSTEVPEFLAMLMPHSDAEREMWSFIPIDSTGAATLRGQRLAERAPLAHGDEIHVSRFILRITYMTANLPEADAAYFDVHASGASFFTQLMW